MPTLGQLYGNDYFRVAYGPQYNAYKYKQALDQSGYVPNENDGLIDSFQSGFAGSMGGLFGEVAGWSKNNGYDWVNNNATWAANKMGDIAARNAYTGTQDSDGILWYGANQAASALGSSVPSIAADVAASAAMDAAIGSVVPGAGTGAGAVVGAVSGVGKGLYNLYKGTRALQYAGKAGKVAGAIAAGGLVENWANAGDTYMTGLSRGMSHEDAWDASNEALAEGWAPAVINYASDRAMLGRGMKGISGAMAVGGGGKVLAKTVGAWAGNAMIGAAGEGLTEAWQTQIQEQALGNEDYANTHIYDPSTWSQDMKDQAYDAAIGSAMLGGLTGGVQSARGYLANRSNTDVASDTIDTNPQPVAQPISEPDIATQPIVNEIEDLPAVGAMPTNVTNLGDVTPDAFATPERGDFDSVFETMGKRFARNRYTNDEIDAKSQAVQDTVARISELWDNQIDENKSPSTLKANDFMEDFVNAGLTPKEAHEASKETVKALQAKSHKADTSIPGSELVRRADSVGLKLTDAQRNDLLSENPIRSNYNAVANAIEDKEVHNQRKAIEANQLRSAKSNRTKYGKRYADSINKPFLDKTMGKNKAEDVGYAIHNAMKERKDDIKAGKKPKTIDKYLANAGINERNYSKDEISTIKNHIKSMDDGINNRGYNKAELKNLSKENADVHKANATYAEATRKYDTKDPRNAGKIEQINEMIADSIIDQGKRGKPIYRYDKYKEFKNKNRKLYNRINEAVYGNQPTTKNEPVETVKAPKVAKPQYIKPKFKKNTLSAKIAKNPEMAEEIKAKELKKAQKVQAVEIKVEEKVERDPNEKIPYGERSNAVTNFTEEQLANRRQEREQRALGLGLEKLKKEDTNDKVSTPYASKPAPMFDKRGRRIATTPSEDIKETLFDDIPEAEVKEQPKPSKKKTRKARSVEEAPVNESLFDNKEENNTEVKEEPTTKEEPVKVTEAPKKVAKPIKKEDKAAKASEIKVLLKAVSLGEVSPKEARDILNVASENATEKEKAEYKRLDDIIKYNTNDKGEITKRDRSDEGRERDAQILRDRLEKFRTRLSKERMSDSEYNTEVKSIERQIEKFRNTHFVEESNYKFTIPKNKVESRREFLKKHENGEVVHPQYLSLSLLRNNSNLDGDLKRWITKEIGSDSNFETGERARHIKAMIIHEYEHMINTYGSEENALKEKPMLVKNLASAIAGSFPKESFGVEGNEIRNRRNELMFDGTKALTPFKFKERDTLINFAKKYFSGELAGKKKEFKREVKVDARQNNGKEVVYDVVSDSVKPLGDGQFKFKVKINNDNEESFNEYLQEVGIGEPENMVKKNGYAEFTSDIYLSYLTFTDITDSTKSKSGKVNVNIYKARGDLIKAILADNETGSFAMWLKYSYEKIGNEGYDMATKEKNIKKRLAELTGESYSSAEYDEGATLFYPTSVEEVEAEGSIPDDSIYQLGSEEDFNAPLSKNYNKFKLADESQEATLHKGLENRLGDAYNDIKEYLENGKDITIQVTKKGTVPMYVPKTDTIYLPEDRINTSSTSFQHELIHSALRDVLTNQKSPEGAIKFAVDMANYIKGEINEYRNNNQANLDTNEVSEKSTSTDGREDSSTQEQAGNDSSTDSNTGSEGVLNGRSEEGIQRNSTELEHSSLGESGQRRESQGQEKAVENNSRAEGVVQGKNSTLKRKVGDEKLLREWNLAEERLNSVTEDTLFEDSVGLKDAVEDIITDPIMNVEDKSNKLLPLLWTASEIDKKFGLDERDSLLRAIYSDKLINLEETMAYTLQNDLSPAHTSALFRTASNILKNKKQADNTNQTYNQAGTEAVEQPTGMGRLAKAWDSIVSEFNKKNDNITFEARDEKQGNISGYDIKKWLASPIKFIDKYIPQMKPIVYWAEEAAVKQNKLQKSFLKSLDKIKTNLGKENVAGFNKLAKEVTDLGREFVQPASVMLRDKELYINIKDNDVFREFKDEIDAKNLYSELKKQGKNVFMDYKDGNFRVFASDDALRTFETFDEAEKVAKPLRNQIMQKKGYNNKVIGAYNAWRNLDNTVFELSVKAWRNAGADPDYKPKRLWAHIPMLHSKYGVYIVKDNVDEDGNQYEQRTKLASFHTYKDAEHWVKDAHLTGDTRVVITERNPKYDEYNAGMDVYDGANDSAYDDIVYEGESRESQEKRFSRISHSYPEVSKIINEFIGEKEHVTRERLMDLINDKKKQQDLGINSKALKDELKFANLDELFRRRDVITRQDMIGHLLIGYGNQRKDKYNNKRMNAQGANPNTFENMENYLRYKANFIPSQEFYHKATALYRDKIGTDYASQFGIGGEGARRDVEDVLHKFISSVVGVPNTFDKAINRTFNELVGDGWIKQQYGDTFATDLMNRGMEAVSIAKLGLFRPTAAIAQLGALMNIGTKAGYGKDFQQALKDATTHGKLGANISFSEQKMFNRIGLNLKDTALETQSLKNRKSLYNLKVGKVKLGKVFEKSMDMFNRTDKYTRRVAALIAYRRAIAEGKSQTEAEHAASDFVRETNFDYSDKDASQLFTKFGTLGKLILQFKKYPVKELEFMTSIIKGGNKKEIARFFGSYIAMAGMMGVPGMTAADTLAEWVSNKSISNIVKEALMEWAGGDDTKKKLALLIMYGTPAPTLGVDFSRNIGIGDLIPTDSLAGPTFGTLANMVESFKNDNATNGMLLSMAHDLSPAFANYYQAATGHKQDWKKGVQGREYSTKERILKGIGFRPVLDAVDADVSQINYINSQESKNAKKAMIYKYINDPSSVTVEELKANNITKKNIADAKKNLGSSSIEKAKRYSSKADRIKNADKFDNMSEFEEDLD